MVSGNHWSYVHFNLETGDGIYADSIGRQVPHDFEDTISNFFFKQYAKYKKKNDFIKSMQIVHEIQSTKCVRKCGYFCVKTFINQRNDISVCGAAAVFSAVTMSDFKIATEIIRKRRMACNCAWMNDLELYSSFARKLLIKWYIEGEIDLSDIGLDCAEVNF